MLLDTQPGARKLDNDYVANPKPGEALMQSAGYTHLLQIGSAADLPTLSKSMIWRRVSQFQETLGTVSNYLFTRGSQHGGFTNEEEAAVTDRKDPTPFAYFGLQQLLAFRLPANFSMLKNILSSVGKPLDDRKLQLEAVVGWLATSGRKRGHGSNKLVNGVQEQLINVLWNDLAHPPTVNLNPKHRFRTPDGRNNNLTGLPLLGAANQPYSRSVAPVHPVPPGLAEPEEMFDAILRRPPGYEGFKGHPAQISSLFLGFANIVIHDLFWTNHGPEVKGPGEDSNSDQYKEGLEMPSLKSQWQNLTSSYASLDPLYGVNEAEQKTVRNRNHLGRGLLYDDTFASSRLLLMPPSSTALLVLFSRNHNRVAKKVLELNERGNWRTDFDQMTPDQLQQQDDEIFGTARHVNCGYFANTILNDYLQAILNTTQVDSDWTLNPRTAIKSLLGSTPKATGNSVTVEFNVLYRWHAPISWSQTQWLEKKFGAALPNKNWDEMTGKDLQKAIAMLKKELNAEPGSEPRNWKLSKYETRIIEHGSQKGLPVVTDEGVYERDPETGKFKDEDLARILKDATNEVSGAFGARHVPAVMKLVECQGMRAARDIWKCATLNEFRSFLGLQEFKTFEEWNSDPAIASSMETLVGHPANIPLHVGLHGEEAKKPGLGAGICLPYTISRAILSDAIALVRGDRFYTDSATADTMTDWGLKDCQTDSQNGAYGGMLERLIRNNLPNQYAFNDCALLFPLIVPEHSYKVMQQIGFQKSLNYSLNPTPQPQTGYQQIKSGDNTLVYEISDSSEMEIQRMGLIFGLNHMNSNIKLVYKAVQVVMSTQDPIKYQAYLESRIRQCSVERSPISKDKTVDIIRDVTNPLITGWLAHVFGLVETGIHSEQLLLCALSDIYYYLTESPQISYKSRAAARVAASSLAWQIKYHIQASASSNNSLRGLIKKSASILTLGATGVLEDSIKLISGQNRGLMHHHADTKTFYQALRSENEALEIPLSTDELAADCLRAISTLAYTIVNGTAHALDRVIPDSSTRDRENPRLLPDLIKLAKNKSQPGSNDYFLRYTLESVRLAHWNPFLRGMIVQSEHQEKKSPVEPIGIIDGKFRLDRKFSTYLRTLDVDGHCLPCFGHMVPIIMKEVLSLPKLRRAPGTQGKLAKIMITGRVESVPTMHVKYNKTEVL